METIITLTLPDSGHLSKSGTLHIARGGLTQTYDFHYVNAGDIASAIRDALLRIEALDADPTLLHAAEQELPTVDVPLRQGTRQVEARCITIASGPDDAAAYQQAVKIAGRLIDGGLWDGESQIRFDDVYAVAKRVRHLTDKEFALFRLSDFAEVRHD